MRKIRSTSGTPSGEPASLSDIVSQQRPMRLAPLYLVVFWANIVGGLSVYEDALPTELLLAVKRGTRRVALCLLM